MSTHPEFDPWQISALSYPGREAPYLDRLRFLIGYAVLAPSAHNAQPWLFRIRENWLELYADRTRALPVVDPHDRTLTMSCGAALFHLRVAARHFGHEWTAPTFPDPERPELLARFSIDKYKPSTHKENTLFGAITRRRTNRFPFDAREVDQVILNQMRELAADEGIRFQVFHRRSHKHALAELIAEGNKIQFADKRFRRELASWIHANRSHSRDGMPGYAYGFGDLVSMAEPFVIRTFDLGKGLAAKEADLTQHSPVICILSTPEDSPRDWLRAGQALAGVLLMATANGMVVSFLNQAIEVELLRPKVAKFLEASGQPQIMFRLGYPTREAKPTPRRSVCEVLRRD